MRGLLPVLLAGCTGVAAAPAPAPTAPAQHPLGAPLALADESMIYEISFRGFRVAQVQVAVGKPGWFEGRPAIIVKSHGETDGIISLLGDLDWELTTTIDLEHGTPIETKERAVVTFRGKTKTHEDTRRDGVHSVHSAATLMRGWRSVAGQRGNFDVRIDRARLAIAVTDAAREFLDRASKPAVRYDGVARDKYPFKVWLSDDAARVPLSLHTSTKWGAVAIELVEYNAPRD